MADIMQSVSGFLEKPEDLLDYIVAKGNGVTGLSKTNLKTVPSRYVQPPHERFDSNQIISTTKSIPIVDMSKLEDPKVAKSICEAASTWGFFQVINHGIPLEVLDRVTKAARDFFELPVEERSKYLKENSQTSTVQLSTSFRPMSEKVLEWKDVLAHFLYDHQEIMQSKHWPPVSRDQVLDYADWVRPLIKKLLEVLLRGLGVKEIKNVMNEYALMDRMAVNLLHYPKCPQPDGVIGVGRHSDVSTITILLQDEVGGLHVRVVDPDIGNGWIPVPPIRGALVVNIGDVMQIISNDKYKSIEHYVAANGSHNRVSVPCFASPSPSSVIGPLLDVMGIEEEPIYKNVVYSKYFNHFFSKGHDGKQTIDYAKRDVI